MGALLILLFGVVIGYTLSGGKDAGGETASTTGTDRTQPTVNAPQIPVVAPTPTLSGTILDVGDDFIELEISGLSVGTSGESTVRHVRITQDTEILTSRPLTQEELNQEFEKFEKAQKEYEDALASGTDPSSLDAPIPR